MFSGQFSGLDGSCSQTTQSLKNSKAQKFVVEEPRRWYAMLYVICIISRKKSQEFFVPTRSAATWGPAPPSATLRWRELSYWHTPSRWHTSAMPKPPIQLNLNTSVVRFSTVLAFRCLSFEERGTRPFLDCANMVLWVFSICSFWNSKAQQQRRARHAPSHHLFVGGSNGKISSFFTKTAIANRQTTSRDGLHKNAAKAHVIINLHAACGLW